MLHTIYYDLLSNSVARFLLRPHCILWRDLSVQSLCFLLVRQWTSIAAVRDHTSHWSLHTGQAEHCRPAGTERQQEVKFLTEPRSNVAV